VAEVAVQVAHVAGALHVRGDLPGLQELLDEDLAQLGQAPVAAAAVVPRQLPRWPPCCSQAAGRVRSSAAWSRQ
jgi:hypothetical protein